MSFILVFFFFKQKTAYEMRISDWSSDVCSSDLLQRGREDADPPGPRLDQEQPGSAPPDIGQVDLFRSHAEIRPVYRLQVRQIVDRSEERRVGKECVSQCRSR